MYIYQLFVSGSSKIQTLHHARLKFYEMEVCNRGETYRLLKLVSSPTNMYFYLVCVLSMAATPTLLVILCYDYYNLDFSLTIHIQIFILPVVQFCPVQPLLQVH